MSWRDDYDYDDLRKLGMRGDDAERSLIRVLELIHRAHVGESETSRNERKSACEIIVNALSQSKLVDVRDKLKALGFGA